MYFMHTSIYKVWFKCNSTLNKGQLISEWNFGEFKSSKKWTLILKDHRAEILQKKVCFLGDLKTPKFSSEINWPLVNTTHSTFELLTTSSHEKRIPNFYEFFNQLIFHLYLLLLPFRNSFLVFVKTCSEQFIG